MSLNPISTKQYYQDICVRVPLSLDAQRGATLAISLIFLVILTMLGVTALRVATMEERMSGNARDKSLAFQAAEAALRDAEFDIRCQKYDGSAAAVKRPIGCISGLTGADINCTNGLCCNPNGLSCVEPVVPVYSNKNMAGAPSVLYGQYTGSVPMAGLSQQPRYFIEPFVVDSKNYYRVTSRGYGLNANTQVTLQEVYKE